MSVLSRVGSLWRGLTRRSSFEAEMDEEFRLHLELRTEDLIRSGLSPAEAARRARLEFGSSEVYKERARASRGLRIFDEMYGDVRYGVRTLLRTPGFTLVAVLTLALGIGATTTIFSVLDAVMIRPLPFRDAGRLVKLDRLGVPFSLGPRTPPKIVPDITDVRALGVFQHVVAYGAGALNLSTGGAPERVPITEVTPGFFETLGVHPVVGRAFVPEEGVPDAPRVAIVSWALWRGRLGDDTALAGMTIALDGKDYRVVGVAPRGFAFPTESEVWIPMSIPQTAAGFEPFRQMIPSDVIARLAPGVSQAQARGRVAALFAPYEVKEPGTAPQVRSLRAALVGGQRTTLLLLFGATALVLLIACANVAHLVLSRATVRNREIAVRATLGATSGRVARQLLVESLMLALAGGAAGAALAMGGTRVLGALIPPVLAGSVRPAVDAGLLGFALTLSLATGLAFGLLPALWARGADAGEVLKSAGTGTTAGGVRARARRGILLAEVTLTVMLLVGSAVMLRSLHALLTTDPGVRPEHVATLEVSLANARFGTSEEKRQFYRSVLGKLEGAPGVEGAGWINELPLRGVGGIRVPAWPEGRRPKHLSLGDFAQDLEVTRDYFRAMGIQVLAGRAPVALPGKQPASCEVAIDQEFAHRLWPGGNPVGRNLRAEALGESCEVVGVVANVRSFTLASPYIPQTYFSMLQAPLPNAALVARGTMPVSALERRLVQAVHDVAPEQAVYDVRTMDDVISRAIEPRRLNTALITVFGVLALLLAAVGVYGVIAFGVARRTQEIGIRMALGADAGRIRRSVLGEALGVELAGCLLGLGGAWALARVLRSFVYGVKPTDPVSFAVAPLVVLAVAALAAFVPARRATKIDPTDAIREA